MRRPDANIRLNIGCGFNKIPGFWNVDRERACEPDEVVDLEGKWPFADNSVTEIRASHILEHLGQQTETFLGIIKEMYRVCADGAVIHISVPHHNHWTFHADPTHCRKILPEGLRLFDQQANRESIRTGDASTPLGLYCEVDFYIEKATPLFDEPWASRLRNQQVFQQDLEFAALHYNSSISQWDIIWRARKKGNA